MEIRSAKQSDFKEICDYNRKAYPEKENIEEYISFWFSKSDTESEKTLIVLNDEGKIVGQTFASSMSYYYNGEKTNTVWGFDLLIDEEYRKRTWGIDLMLQQRKMHKYSFATGSNDNALALNLKLGCTDLGRIRKYVGLVAPFNIFTSVFRHSFDSSKFPSYITVKDVVFNKLEYTDFPSINKPYNEDLLEISREKSFLQWRYHNKLHEYAFYKSESSDDYFVVRTIVKKHITAMVLVDYRCDLTDESSFSILLEAAKSVTRKMHLAILIVGSSLTMCDKILEKSKFKSTGRPRPIIGHIKVPERKNDIENRNFIFVTLADSDGETMW